MPMAGRRRVWAVLWRWYLRQAEAVQETPDAGRVSDLRGLFWKGVGSEGAVEDGFRTGTPGLCAGGDGCG